METLQKVERKVFLISNGEGFDASLEFFELPSQKDMKIKRRYLYNSSKDVFNEIKKIEHFGSFFQGDYLIEDGNVYLISEINPLFLMIPYLLKARGIATEESKGKMLQLDHILASDNKNTTSLENVGKHILKNSKTLISKLSLICETLVKSYEENETFVFLRIDQAKFDAWLETKFTKTKILLEQKFLGIFESAIAESTARNIQFSALELLYDYLPELVFEEFSMKYQISIKMMLEFKVHKRKYEELTEDENRLDDEKTPNQKLKKVKVNDKLVNAAKNTKSLTSFFTKK